MGFTPVSYWNASYEQSLREDCRELTCQVFLGSFALFVLACCGTMVRYLVFNEADNRRCYVRRGIAFFFSTIVAAYEIYTGILSFSRIHRIRQDIKGIDEAWSKHMIVWLICSGLGFVIEPTIELRAFGNIARIHADNPKAKILADAEAFKGLVVQVLLFWPGFALVYSSGTDGRIEGWFIYPSFVALLGYILKKTAGRRKSDGDTDGNNDSEDSDDDPGVVERQEMLAKSLVLARAHNVVQILAIAAPIIVFEYFKFGALSLLGVLMTVSDLTDLVFIALESCDCGAAAIETVDRNTRV